MLVDAHVHIYDCHRPGEVLDSAAANFRAAASGLGLPQDTPAYLMFTESQGMDRFGELRDGRAGDVGAWRFEPTGEECSLAARRGQGPGLFLVAGRQVVAREKLEVLALGCTARLEDGQPLEETLDTVAAAGALAVLPWGFGKWWFRRGALVAGLLEAWPGDLFLGDNGGRPRLGPRPRLFRVAAARGVRILPGTDPLPFSSEAGKAGRCGFVLAGQPDPGRPAAWLKARLEQDRSQPQVYGRFEGLLTFCWNQVRMQCRKRLMNPKQPMESLR